MKKFIKTFFIALFVCLLIVGLGLCFLVFRKAHANNGQMNVIETVKTVSAELSNVTKNADKSQVNAVMDVLSERTKDGTLSQDEGVKSVLQECAQSAGVEIPEEVVTSVESALDTLEGMGFSAQSIADSVTEVYEKYGTEFADHMEEAFVNAAKDAAGNSAQSAWESLESTVKNLF